MEIVLEKALFEDVSEINKIQKIAFKESIHPEFQNLGIGTKAIDLVEKYYADALIWTLLTPEKEIRNRRLYEKLKYRQIGKEVVNEYLTLIRYKKDLC